jgi:hypothetical protein
MKKIIYCENTAVMTSFAQSKEGDLVNTTTRANMEK